MHNFFWQKARVILYCLNMSCIVIFQEWMNFLRLTFNVSLLTFRWNFSNDRRSSSCICPTSVWTSEHSNWSWMLRTVLCRASKPLKLVALSIQQMSRWALATNDLLQYVLPIIPNLPDGAFIDFILPPQSPFVQRVWLAQLCNNFTSLDFSQAGCLRFHMCPLAIHRIRRSKKWYE